MNKEDIMSRVLSFFAYSAAVLCIFAGIATFVGNKFFAGKIATATGIRISPVFSGGDVVRTLQYKGYEVNIHEAVFEGLFSPRENGFVQVDFVGEGIPVNISQEIDYDNDGVKDFSIIYDTKTGKGSLIPFDKRVVSLGGVYVVKKGYAARIRLKNVK